MLSMKKRKFAKTFIFLALLLIGGVFGYGMRPQCSPIADEALAHFGVPIEERQDRDFYMKVFQHRADGHWYQCKTALSRKFFF